MPGLVNYAGAAHARSPLGNCPLSRKMASTLGISATASWRRSLTGTTGGETPRAPRRSPGARMGMA